MTTSSIDLGRTAAAWLLMAGAMGSGIFQLQGTYPTGRREPGAKGSLVLQPSASQCEQFATFKPAPGTAGYRQRGDLCEGLYLGPLAGGLELVSLTRGELTLDLGRDMEIDVGAAGDLIRVQARSIPELVFYQMDAWVPQSGRLTWPPGLLRGLGLPPGSVGVVAWTAGGSGPVYIPIRGDLRPGGRSATDNVHVVVRAREKVDEVRWRLVPDRLGVSSGKARQAPEWTSSSLGWRAWEPIRLVPLKVDTGVHQLEVDVKKPNGSWDAVLLRLRGVSVH